MQTTTLSLLGTIGAGIESKGRRRFHYEIYLPGRIVNTNEAMKKLLFLLSAVIAITFAPQASQAQAYPNGVYIRFENHTGYTVHGLYMSPHASYLWGRDLLDVDTLRDNESATVWSDYITSQRYDVRIVYGDGSEYIFDQINFNPTKVDRAWITADNRGYVTFQWD